MENNSRIQRKSKVKRILLRSALALIALFVVLQLAWTISGSNQWELVRAENGVEVYSLKSPGSTLKKFKGIVRLETSLSAIAMFMLDPNADACDYSGCTDLRTVESQGPHVRYYTFKYDFPLLFKTRAYVIEARLFQNPHNKVLHYSVIAAPNKIPLDDCCVRVARMFNTWRFVPLGNGAVDVEFVVDMDEGGFVPTFLMNSAYPEFIYYALSNVQSLLNQEEYQDLQLDYIQEIQ